MKKVYKFFVISIFMKNNSRELFIERMKKLLGNDFENYWNSIDEPLKRSIRVNTLKISPEKLKEKLKDKGWKISQPFKDYPEIIIIESNLLPGELGRSLEHLLGYYYVQDISSMLPVIALNPKENEVVLDLCASPGSKTSQMAAKMKNTGTIIANDVKLGRIRILATNLERTGVMNTIITKSDGIRLCKNLKGEFEIDKILLDAPCSGEGTLKNSKIIEKMWNVKKITSLSKIQKRLFESAFELLKPGGEIVYSTCTYAPEENEEVVNFMLEKFKNLEAEKVFLPREIKCHPGIEVWQDEKFSKEMKKSCRVYTQETGTEGFFIAKFKKTS